MGQVLVKYSSLPKPPRPGFYWLAAVDGQPRIVEVDVEPDSHNMLFVRVPNDDHKYPLRLLTGVSWFGPLDEIDLQFALSRCTAGSRDH